MAGMAPALLVAPVALGAGREPAGSLLLDDFEGNAAREKSGVSWQGFTDRVMGGRSDSEVGIDVIAGKSCARMTGTVTRRNGGGFIQLAMYFDRGSGMLDASAYKGISLLVYGNNEDYNLHLQTSDARWYDSSYRTTFRATPEWTRVNLPWSAFLPNNIPERMRTQDITRIGLLGWMREFEADIALGEISLYS